MLTGQTRFLTFAIDSLTMLLIGSWLFWRYRRNRLTRSFAYAVLGIAGYCFFVAVLSRLQDEAAARAWVRSFVFLAHLMILTFYWFSIILSRFENRFSRFLLMLGIAGFGVELFLRVGGFVPVMLQRQGDQGWFPVADPVYNYLYLPLTAVLVATALVAQARRFVVAPSGLEKIQLFYVFAAYLLFGLVCMVNLVPSLAWLASLGPMVFVGIISYAITRQRLLDTSLLVTRGAVAAGAATAVAGAFVGLLAAGMQIWHDSADARNFAAFVTMLVLVLTYDPLRRGILALVERLGGQKRLNSSQRLLEYSLLYSSSSQLQEYLRLVVARLRVDLDLASAAVLLRGRLGGLEAAAASPEGLPGALEIPPDEPALKWLAEKSQGVDADELGWLQAYESSGGQLVEGDQVLKNFMLAHGLQALFPWTENGRLEGLLALGPRVSGRSFGVEDFDFLTALSVQLESGVRSARLQSQIQQADRLSMIGTLAAGLAHELRNPLTSISTFVQMLPRRHGDEAFRDKFMRIVGAELQKLSRLTGQMLDFSGPTSAASSPSAGQVIDLRGSVERATQLIHYQFKKKEVALEFRCPEEPVPVRAEDSEISQVVMNLALNALQASPAGSTVKVEVALEGREALLRVVDQGTGMSREQLQRAFEPFYTTKDDGNGLGLPICRRIVEQGGGVIEVNSQPGAGSSFVVRLGLADQEPKGKAA